MKGRLIDLSRGMNGKQRVTVELDADFREGYNRLKDDDVEIEIRKYRMKRSKNANAYFHLLVGKIAEALGLGLEEVKVHLNTEYGTFDRDEDGLLLGLKLPASVNPSRIYPYTKFFQDAVENGKPYKHYLVFKKTHELNSKEMARLIDGAIHEAQELGIETDTPEQIERYKSLWQQAEKGATL